MENLQVGHMQSLTVPGDRTQEHRDWAGRGPCDIREWGCILGQTALLTVAVQRSVFPEGEI